VTFLLRGMFERSGSDAGWRRFDVVKIAAE